MLLNVQYVQMSDKWLNYSFCSVSVADLLYAGTYYPSPQPVVITQPVMAVVPLALGESPIATTCPNCHQSVVSAVTYEIGGLTWLIFAILCLLGYV